MISYVNSKNQHLHTNTIIRHRIRIMLLKYTNSPTNIIIELQSPRVGCIEFKNKKKIFERKNFSLRKIKRKINLRMVKH